MKGLGIDTTDNFIDIKTTEGLVIESLKRILYTRPFERLNRPNFGVGIERFLFSHIGLIEQQLKDSIEEQISEFEKRIILEDIEITTDDGDSHKVFVLIKYRLRDDYLTPRQLEIEV